MTNLCVSIINVIEDRFETYITMYINNQKINDEYSGRQTSSNHNYFQNLNCKYLLELLNDKITELIIIGDYILSEMRDTVVFNNVVKLCIDHYKKIDLEMFPNLKELYFVKKKYRYIETFDETTYVDNVAIKDLNNPHPIYFYEKITEINIENIENIRRKIDELEEEEDFYFDG